MRSLFFLPSVCRNDQGAAFLQCVLVRGGLSLLLMAVLSGCSTVPGSADGAEPVAVQSESLNDLLGRAETEEKLEGGRERTRLIYRDAAKAYPTDKRPWQRLAQSYFDATDYGNAVLAAQEVVQRDPTDSVAQGLLAISGLRVATAALAGLRSQSGLNGSTRTEADEMARNLRSILGQSVLVPKVGESAVGSESPEQARAPVASKPSVTPVVRPAVRKPPVKGGGPQVPAANPFGGLR